VSTVEPRISLIVPFLDPDEHPRGRTHYLASWTRDQTLPAEAFEVIAVIAPGTRVDEAEIRNLLRPHDRVVRGTPREPLEQYPAGLIADGAAQATAPILVFTEDHVVAEPGCLAALLAFLDDPAYAGVTARTEEICETRVARLGRLLDGLDRERLESPAEWFKFRTRCGALRREAYERAGGLDPRAGIFGETALAAALHEAGGRVAYYPEARAHHAEIDSLALVAWTIRSYTRGECRLAAELPPRFAERYFDASVVLGTDRYDDPATARRLLRFALRLWTGGRTGRALARGARREIRGCIAGAAGSRRRRQLGARLRAGLARLRMAVHRDDARAFEAFQAYRDARVAIERAAYRLPQTGPGTEERVSLRAGEFPARDLIGGYGPASLGDVEVRWLRPLAGIRFRLVPGAFRVTLDTAGMRGEQCDFALAFAWDGNVIAAEGVVRGEGCVSFDVTPDMVGRGDEHWLFVACEPFRAPGDPRSLAFPLAAVTIEPAGAAADSRAPAVAVPRR
jgi:hypothetical protein